MKIFKYVLAEGKQIIKVDHLVKVLSVAEQNGDIVLYCIVDESNSNVYPNYWTKSNEVEVLIVGTGHERKESLEVYRFLGTVNVMDGKLMFHIFWRFKDEKFPC